MKAVICSIGSLLAAASFAAGELPAGYTAVEYLVAPKGAYVDTGYTANGQTKVVFDAVVPPRWEQNDRFGVLFGSRTMTDWTTKAFALQMCTGNSETLDTVRFVYNGEYRQDGSKPFSFGERVTVTCDGQHVEWTGGKAASVEFTADPLESSKSTLYIFADNSVSGDGAKSPAGLNHSVMCLYSFMIYEGDTRKRNFVPCVRMADAVAGLYDTVEGKFYGNAGAGAFATSASALPFGRELASGTYKITETFAFVAPAKESALKIADGATVELNVAAGVTVAFRGGDAVEVWGAGAGIEVPANATLKVTGAGQLVACGGRGANGCNGVNGGNGSADRSTGNFTSGAGGAGGYGGGGAGAGIGGRANSSYGSHCGNIYIHGGKIRASSVLGAGIGGGTLYLEDKGCDGPAELVIYGGEIFAESVNGAGIGGGGSTGDNGKGGSCGSISVFGGVVEASGAEVGIGPGPGEKGQGKTMNLKISGGRVFAHVPRNADGRGIFRVNEKSGSRSNLFLV